VIGPLALLGYAAAGLLAGVCVLATLPGRSLRTRGITALLGVSAGLLGGVAGAVVLDIQAAAFFCPHGWASAIAAAAVVLASWRAVAPGRRPGRRREQRRWERSPGARRRRSGPPATA
jgi:hypothetical protein